MELEGLDGREGMDEGERDEKSILLSGHYSGSSVPLTRPVSSVSLLVLYTGEVFGGRSTTCIVCLSTRSIYRGVLYTRGSTHDPCRLFLLVLCPRGGTRGLTYSLSLFTRPPFCCPEEEWNPVEVYYKRDGRRKGKWIDSGPIRKEKELLPE